MQVFRLFGMPDSVIAFDALPERLLQGFEMMPADGFPRHWKEFLGKSKKITKLRPERDPRTLEMISFPPIVEEGYFFYAVDYMVNPVVEKWKEVCDFVRANVTPDTRLKERIDDMAIPFAAGQSPVSIEPEEITIIKIPLDRQELKTEPIIAPTEAKEETSPPLVPRRASTKERCLEEGCPSVFEGAYAKNALRMHHQQKHVKKPVTV